MPRLGGGGIITRPSLKVNNDYGDFVSYMHRVSEKNCIFVFVAMFWGLEKSGSEG